jgi:hypothetical protein
MNREYRAGSAARRSLVKYIVPAAAPMKSGPNTSQNSIVEEAPDVVV